MSIPELRVGQGYDFHRLEARRPLMLGGIDVAAERGAIGHSEATCCCTPSWTRCWA